MANEATTVKGFQGSGLDHDFATMSHLHVPDAQFRPGEEPRFRRFREQPGDLSRPDPLASVADLNDHAHGLVRVLDDEGHALGPWDPALPAARLRNALELMVRVRQFDSRMMKMQRQGKLSFYLESKGEEAVAIGAGLALHPEDLLFPYYRQQGLMLCRGATILDMMCQCIGNARDLAKARQMPVHYTWRKGNIVSISSPVATQFPQAVGAAMAAAIRRQDNVVAGWIGDGATAEGDFHYGLTFAAVYRPPVILNIVNNQWAISTPCCFAGAGRSFAARGIAYEIPGIRVDGNDLLAVYAVTEWAADRARKDGGPTLIELVTYRAGAHSSSDDPARYRPADEAQFWPGGDPIRRLADHLILRGEWSEEQQRQLEEQAERDTTLAYKEAETYGTMTEGPWPPAATLFDDVYAEQPWHLRAQRQELGA